MNACIDPRSGMAVLAAVATLAAHAGPISDQVGAAAGEQPDQAASYAASSQADASAAGIGNPLSLGRAWQDLDRRADSGWQDIGGARLAFAYDRRPAPFAHNVWFAARPDASLSAFSVVAARPDGRDASVGVGGLAAGYFGTGGLSVGGNTPIGAEPALANPYFSLAPRASHAGVSREVAGIKIKFGILSTGLHHMMATQAFEPGTLSPALVATQPRFHSRLLEFSKSARTAAVSFSLMRSREANVGGFGVGSSTLFSGATSSAQMTGIVLLAPKTALAAQASYGRTANSIAAGWIGNAAHTRSNAFSVAVVASDRYRQGDRLSLSVSQPIRVYAARGRTAWPLPTGRELLTEIHYVRPLGETAAAGWTVALRRNPNNIAGAPTEKLIALRFIQQY